MSETNASYYLGIDPSLTGTGLGILQCNKHECVRSAHRIVTKTRGTVRLQYIRQAILEIMKSYPYIDNVKNICIEGPALNSTHQADKLGQIRGVLMVMSLDHFVLPTEVPPLSLKKFATGHGHSSKEKMIMTARDAGWRITNDDEADAAWLAELARALYDKNLALNRRQLEAIRGIQSIGHKIIGRTGNNTLAI